MPEVERRLGVTASTIYRWIREGHFPAPVKLGVGPSGRVRWRAADVDGWLDARGTEPARA